MNIALCTDEKYAFPCGVCITSILENNKDEECNIYILTSGLTNKTTRKFNELSKCYNQNIEIITIDNNSFNNLKVCNRFPTSIYYRFLLPDLLVNIDKILYLDCDIIVTGSIKELWETDIRRHACGVIEDQKSDDIRIQNRLELYTAYFNSGVLLINLDYWRENQTAEKLIEFIYQNPDKCVYPDQDALNFILHDNVKFLEYKYNYQEFFYIPKEETFLHKRKWCNLIYDEETPIVVHYTNETKPWITTCNHPHKDLFYKYKAISPWHKYKIKSPYTAKGKIVTIIKQVIRILKL